MGLKWDYNGIITAAETGGDELNLIGFLKNYKGNSVLNRGFLKMRVV